MRTTIYYFTGTGNSLKIAKDISEKLKDCDLVPIVKLWEQDKIVSKTEKVGFIFPLYWWGLPKIVYEFIKKIELDKTNYIFAIVTSGGGKTGGSLVQLNRHLKIKSKFLNAGFSIKMPDNYIPVFKLISEEKQNVLFEKANEQVKKISEIIKNNENIINKKSNKYIASTVNNKFRKKVNDSVEKFYSDENCNSCGVCVNVCPVNNIILTEGKPEWQHKCQKCLACIHFCPQRSIQYGKKTQSKKRYHNPDINIQEIINQKL